MTKKLATGDTLRFKHEAERRQYGETGRIEEISRTISRPYGAITTWYDIVTENGTKLQWPTTTVRANTVKVEVR